MLKLPFFLIASAVLMMQQTQGADAVTAPKPASPPASDPDGNDVYHVAIFRFPNEHLKQATSALREMAVAARRERGAIQYDVYRGSDNPQVFYIVEHWASPQAFIAHEHSQAFIHLGQGVLGKYATLHEAVTGRAFDVANLALPDQ